MHRIDHGSATVGGLFQNNTVITPEWANAVQEELVAIVESVGLTLDKPNNAQVLEALRLLSLPNRVAFTVPGTGTFTVPTGFAGSNVGVINVLVAGAGGGGGFDRLISLTPSFVNSTDGEASAFTGNGHNLQAAGGERGVHSNNAIVAPAVDGGGSGGDYSLIGQGARGGTRGTVELPTAGEGVAIGSPGAAGGLTFKRIATQSGQTFNYTVGAGGRRVSSAAINKEGRDGQDGFIIIEY